MVRQNNIKARMQSVTVFYAVLLSIHVERRILVTYCKLLNHSPTSVDISIQISVNIGVPES